MNIFEIVSNWILADVNLIATFAATARLLCPHVIAENWMRFCDLCGSWWAVVACDCRVGDAIVGPCWGQNDVEWGELETSVEEGVQVLGRVGENFLEEEKLKINFLKEILNFKFFFSLKFSSLEISTLIHTKKKIELEERTCWLWWKENKRRQFLIACCFHISHFISYWRRESMIYKLLLLLLEQEKSFSGLRSWKRKFNLGLRSRKRSIWISQFNKKKSLNSTLLGTILGLNFVTKISFNFFLNLTFFRLNIEFNLKFQTKKFRYGK